MAQLVACPECKKPLQVPDELLGKKVQCPECKHTFTAALPDAAPEKISTTTKAPALPSKKPAWEKSESDSDVDLPIRKSKRRRADDDDDEDDDDDDRPSRRRRRRSLGRGNFVPHRGGMILAFGIIGLVGGLVLGFPAIFGIVAWVMGNNDLKEIQAGRMDPEGEGQTQTGRILGMIATILWITGMVIGCGFVIIYFICIVAIIGGAAANANKNFPNRPPR